MDFLRTKPHLIAKYVRFSKDKNYTACLLEVWSALHLKTTVWKDHYFAEWQNQKRALVTLPEDTA